jgi:hypothetical protein
MLRTLMLLTSFPGLLTGADDGCDRLRQAKDSSYGFSPASLSKLEKTAKLLALDRFWNLAKSNPKQSAACLRAMLEKERRDSFFLFDGSQLLFSLDKSARSAEVVAEALSSVDLGDVNSYDYVALAIEVSKTGADISSAAMNFARARNVEDYAQGAGARMNREQGIVAVFGRLPVEVAVAKGKALYQSGDAAASPYGLLVLALALTPDALAILKQAGDITSLPAAVRRQISALLSPFVPQARPAAAYRREQLLAMLKSAPNYAAGLRGPSGNEDFLGSATTGLQAEDAPLVREARRQSIVDASISSMHQYYAYTHMLRVVETKAGLFDSRAAPPPAPAAEKKPKLKPKSKRKARKK